MKIRIISVGKIRKKIWGAPLQEYLKHLCRFAIIEMIEVKDERVPEKVSPRERELIIKKEGSRILEKIRKDEYVIALHPSGKSFSSEELADYLEKQFLFRQSNLTFIIGGTLGLSQELLNFSQLQLSLSTLTFPHQLCRIILLEQLFRAFKLMHGQTYHR